jgi:acetate kinase
MTRALVLNAGSSNLKWSLLDAESERVLESGGVVWQGERWKDQVKEALARAPDCDAIGHRVVHGGTFYREGVRIDGQVRERIASLERLAPDHTRPALAGIDACSELWPKTPQIAAFDTAFHATIPLERAIYPLPYEWTERFGARRFGFHGLSVAYVVRRAGELLGRVPARLVVLHLGAGCSATAVRDGRSADTTMGFTPLEGMMMATRSGSVDPGLLLFLLENEGVAASALDAALHRRSGLLGVSGVSSDLREVLAAADLGAPRARLAYAMFVHGVRRAVAAMIASLGGFDAIAFTGGIGENSARLREDALAALGFTGLCLDPDKNRAPPADRNVSAGGAPVLVVHAREDLAILAEMRRVLDLR